jgi:hypothetical protein
MSNLGPQQINSSYPGLLQVPGGATATLKTVTDGLGTEVPIQISTTNVVISGLTNDYAANLIGGSAGRIPYQTGLSSTAFTTVGIAGQVLVSSGTGAPAWSNTAPSALTSNTALSSTNLLGGSAGQLPYQTGSGATGFIANGFAGQVLRSNGALAPSWTTLNAISVNALPITGGSMSGAIDMNNYALTDLPAPSAASDAATKAYVDSVATGLNIKASCVAATTANITLSGAQTIDTVAVTAGQRVLVKNQTTTADNGIYVCDASTWTRSTDADTWSELVGATVFITGGSANLATTWTCNVAAGGLLGVTPVTFVQFAGSQSYTAGNGLTLVGTQFSLSAPVSVTNGGTGVSTLTGIAYGNATSAFTAATAAQIVSAIGSTAVTNATNAASCSGNAATATALETARLINGVSFNGTANISITASDPYSLTFNTSGAGAASGATFDGSAARTISYNTIGAANVSGSNATAGSTWDINIARTAAYADDLNGGSAGNVIYQSAAGSTAFLANGSAGLILASNGVGSSPYWTSTAPGAVNVVSKNAGDILYQSSTNVTAGLAIAPNGYILASDGVTPVWTAGINLSTQAIGVLPISNGGTGASTAANAINNLLPYQGATPDRYLKTDGTNVSWQHAVSSVTLDTLSTGLLVNTLTSATITTAGTFNLSGVLNATNGGTGVSTLSGIVYGNGTSAFTAATGPQVVGVIGANYVQNATNATNSVNSTTATNLANGTAGAIVYQSSASTTDFVSGTSGRFLQSNGSAAPAFVALSAGAGLTFSSNTFSLDIPVTVANGGTGVTTLSGVLYGNGTSAVSSATGAQIVDAIGSVSVENADFATLAQNAFFAGNIAGKSAGQLLYQSAPDTTSAVAAGVSNQILLSAGTSAPVWANSAPKATNLDAGVAGSVPYQSAIGVTAYTAAGANNQVLTSNGTVPQWSNSVSSANNLAGGAAGAVPYQSATGTTAFSLSGASGQFLSSTGSTAPTWTTITPALIGALAVNGSNSMSADLNMSAYKITNLATPTNSGDAANKSYVDSVASGLNLKTACVAATTANITLSGTQTIDGVSVVATNRVLVKNQSASAENGIYVVDASTWSRSTDADTWSELVGATVFVTGGSTNGTTTWACNVSPGGTLGTTPVTFVQFSGSQSYTAGAGLTLAGNQFSITAPVSVSLGGTGVTTLSGIAYGNGTSAFTAASAAQIVSAIGSTPVANATTAASCSGNSATSDKVNNAVTFSADGTGDYAADDLLAENNDFILSEASSFIVTQATGSTTFDGSSALNISYNSINAAAIDGNNVDAGSTWNINVSGTSTSLAGGDTGNIPYQLSSGQTAFLNTGGIGYILTSDGYAPQWSATIDLASNVSGVLSPQFGGTGAVSLTGIFYGNALGAATAATPAQIVAAIGSESVQNSYFAGTAVLAQSSLDISGGNTGQLVYQGSPGFTTFLTAGTNGQALTYNTSLSRPQWTTLGDLSLINTNASTTQYLRGDGTWVTPPVNAGTVTSVALTAPTGFSVSGSPVTASGTLALSFAAGYSLPTTASQANWDNAYSQRLQWDGGSTNLNAVTGRTSLGLGSLSTLSPTGAASSSTFLRGDGVWATPPTAVGTVTSVGLTVPTGLVVAGSPITSSGTFAVSLQSGYSIPTTASQANWDSAYTQRLQWDGGATNLNATTGRASLGLGNVATISTNGSTSQFLRGDGAWATPAAGSGTVTSVGTGTGLTGGPITTSGTISLANTSVTPGSYTSANITVDAQGRITAASNGSAAAGVTQIVAGSNVTISPAGGTGVVTINASGGGGGSSIYFNVTAYGASPSASPSANRAAFQNAINAAATSRGTVYVPAGTYAIDDTLVLSNVNLLGEGTASYIAAGIANAASPIIYASGMISVRNLQIGYTSGVTGNETQGQKVIFRCGDLRPSIPYGNLRNSIFDYLLLGSCGTAFYESGQFTDAAHYEAVFSTTFSNIWAYGFRYRAFDFHSAIRTGNVYQNVYLGVGDDNTTCDCFFALQGIESESSIIQLNVEHGTYKTAGVIFDGCEGIGATSMHIEAIKPNGNGKPYVRCSHSSGSFNDFTIINCDHTFINVPIFELNSSYNNYWSANGVAGDSPTANYYHFGVLYIGNVPTNSGCTVFSRGTNDGSMYVDIGNFEYGPSWSAWQAFPYSGNITIIDSGVNSFYGNPVRTLNGSTTIGNPNLTTANNGTPFFLSRPTNGSVLHILINNVASGQLISTSGGTPGLFSGSDYRLKENVAPITDALDRIKKIKSYQYNIIGNNSLQEGFLAHELEDVCSLAVHGSKDAVDEDGNPVYQQVAPALLIPVLAQAVHDLLIRLEALENK